MVDVCKCQKPRNQGEKRIEMMKEIEMITIF